jgi:repressor LexA
VPDRSASQGPRLTPRQLQILTVIRDFQRSRGYSPTMQELADTFGVSKVTIFEHVEALIAKGLLQRSPYRARSLEITSVAVFPDERPTSLPLVGRIAAGTPIEAVESPEVVDLEEVFAAKGERFVLQVNGDSMIDDQIRDGDYVVVEKRDTAADGDTVVALLDNGEATLKKLYHDGARIRLQPANPNYQPICLDSVKIQGVVIGVLRTYRRPFARMARPSCLNSGPPDQARRLPNVQVQPAP